MVGVEAGYQVKAYRVDGEVGRFKFETHRLEQEGKVVFDTSQLFPPLKGKEWYRTRGFKEIALVHGSVDASYRKTTVLLNRVRHQPEATPSRTLSDNSEREGQRLLVHLSEKAEQILDEHQFSQSQPPPPARAQYQAQPWLVLPVGTVTETVKACAPDESYEQQMLTNPVAYEQPAQSIQVSIDPVGVKKQKESRDGKAKEKRAWVYQPVVHLQYQEQSYTLNGYSLKAVLQLVLAFLLHNGLLKYNLLFFVDGQRSLNQAIAAAFGWFGPVQLILDWYHLEKKCQQLLSLALVGREVRHQILDQVTPLLWLGCVQRAIGLLQAVEPDKIKDQTRLTELIGYLERHQPYLPCYAVRQKLGLRNSSNRGEKANDLLVSARQKDNGMSWSQTGSVTLAALTALVRNDEYKGWFQSQSIRFSFA